MRYSPYVSRIGVQSSRVRGVFVAGEAEPWISPMDVSTGCVFEEIASIWSAGASDLRACPMYHNVV
jgi:hypothetical protein